MRDQHIIQEHGDEERIPSDTAPKPDVHYNPPLPEDFCEEDPDRPLIVYILGE